MYTYWANQVVEHSFPSRSGHIVEHECVHHRSPGIETGIPRGALLSTSWDRSPWWTTSSHNHCPRQLSKIDPILGYNHKDRSVSIPTFPSWTATKPCSKDSNSSKDLVCTIVPRYTVGMIAYQRAFSLTTIQNELMKHLINKYLNWLQRASTFQVIGKTLSLWMANYWLSAVDSISIEFNFICACQQSTFIFSTITTTAKWTHF